MSLPLSIGWNTPFNEAIQATVSRGVVLPDVYYGKLQGIHRQFAFSIANVAKVDQLQAVLDSLTHSLNTGGTFANWQRNVDVKALAMPKHRLDNIFRTNIQSAYNSGHWQQQLANKSTRPYLVYDAINDSRTRPSHKANDGIIRKIDDPIWKRIWFSRNVYRCRCRLISLSEEQAIARSKNGTGLQKTETLDPTRDTAWDSVDVMNADVMTFGIERAIAKRLADNTINPALQQAFVHVNASIKAQQVALDLGVKTVDYAGRSDIAQVVNTSLAEFKQRGLAIPDNVLVSEARFNAWATQMAIDAKDLTAAFVPNKAQTETFLFLNPLYTHWGDLKIDAARQFQLGEWSTDSAIHIVAHEMGHFLHYVNDRQNYLLLQTAVLEAHEQLIAAKISRYAQEGAIEFVAEVFVGLLTGHQFDADTMALYKKLKGVVP
jgi:SPP1 gp7 family putative phage head morphogenesis protein